ncbi:hypothetical protein [Portibacter marinus]|uniref:hypothetical protein n=1 Tax=Portibacter marinus TaxID=2898660 RepID=UPI001F47C7CF|nr:hypothetical protein [Portibacter marinus]
MKRLSDFFYLRSNIWICLLLTIITFGFLFLAMVPATECYSVKGSEEISLGTSFGFSYELVKAYLSAMTDEMLECFRTFHHIWDNVFAVFYGLMNVAWLSLLFRPSSSKFKAANLIPFLQTIFDWLENYQLSGLAFTILTDEGITQTGVQVASVFNMTKWVIYGVFFLLILLGLTLRIRRFIKSKH